MSKMTIKVLAAHLGLSISTISKALKDSHEISATTKSKVLQAAAEMGYIPNPYASSLRKQKSKTIAVIIPEVSDSFFAQAINGIETVATLMQYHTLIYLSHDSFQVEKEIIKHCSNGRVDGVLISVSKQTTDTLHFDLLKKSNIPFVFFDRDLENYEAPKVLTNDFESGYLAARHLFSMGCSHPVFLSPSDSLSVCNRRYDGFVKASEEVGLINQPNNFKVVDCHQQPENITSQIIQILQKDSNIAGIIASVEDLAIHGYLACLELKLQIPNDILLIGFTSIKTADLFSPTLTTITQPAFEIGKRAATILFELIDNKGAQPSHYPVILPSTLIQRASTGNLTKKA
jgi:LacI family transcriptional regulator